MCMCVFRGVGISGKTGDRTNIWSWQVDGTFQSNIKTVSLEFEILKMK